jgi:predicted nucleic acid-binding Zn ribbon protein
MVSMKKRVKNTISTIIFFVVLGMIVSSIVFVIYLYMKQNPSELNQGIPSEEFCSEKCGEDDLLTSNNNSVYGFIRCECVKGVEVTTGYKKVSSKAITSNLYFDSTTLKEISEQEVLNRIKTR